MPKRKVVDDEMTPLVSGIEDLALAYADFRGQPGRRLLWRSRDLVTPERARQAFWNAGVKLLHRYELFTPNLLTILPKFFGPNVLVQPAREYSVAIYVKPDPERYIDADQLIEAKKRLGADEIGYRDEFIRIWWD